MDFAPENDLEGALVAAATSPEARPRFYRVLAESQLFVIDENPAGGAVGRQTLGKGMTLQIRPMEIDGVPHLPCFSSATRIRHIVKTQVRYVAMKAGDLFALVGPVALVLNPGSEYGKQFTPEEIKGIQDGSLFQPRSTEVVASDRQIMLGQPANYPAHITGPLSAFFKTEKSVRAAYLAHYFDPASSLPPHTLIGVDVEAGGDWDRIMGEAALVLDGIARKEEVVDFIRIDGNDVSRYMTEQTKAFYRKRWLGLI